MKKQDAILFVAFLLADTSKVKIRISVTDVYKQKSENLHNKLQRNSHIPVKILNKNTENCI